MLKVNKEGRRNVSMREDNLFTANTACKLTCWFMCMLVSEGGWRGVSGSPGVCAGIWKK